MATSALVLVVALYASVATAYLEARRRREAPPRWARGAGALAVSIHLAGLVVLSLDMGRSPFASASQSLSFLAFCLGALYLVLESTSRVATHGGGFWTASALLAALGVPGLVGANGASVLPADPERTVHIGLALLATAAVLAGGLLAAGYLDAYRRVKRHRLSAGEHGPSLRGFERLSRAASALGVALLLPALVLGATTAVRDGARLGALLLVVVTGVLLALLVLAAWLWWWRPLRGALAAWLTLAGTAIALVAFVVHPLLMGAGR